MGDFIFDYFVGSFFESMVVGIFAVDAYVATENNLSLVYELGFLHC